MRTLFLLVFAALAATGWPANGAEPAPVAEILGRAVSLAELDAGRPPADPAKPPPVEELQRWRGERLRALVWSAVFEDYAREHNIVVSEAEIASNIRSQERTRERLQREREAQRAALQKELAAPTLEEGRRAAAQLHLDMIERIRAFDAQRDRELRDPARRAQLEAAERMIAQQWVRSWKINQALYHEFGGRIVFQQAGWEPLDAYRKLFDRYAGRKAFVVHDPSLRAAVYGYFDHKFVYADEARAKFYFEKPWWERTPAELKAAGF